MLRHLTSLAFAAGMACPAPVASVAAELAYVPACLMKPGPRRAVTKVIDGETLELDDGSQVRLIGALAPLRPAATVGTGMAPWPPAAAARRELQILTKGRSVELAYAGDRMDRHGRRLAQVFLTGPGARAWLQGELLARGLARAYGLPGNDACLKDMLELEAAARKARAGIWSNAAYQIRSAHRPGALFRYRHSFQIIEGRVSAVGRGRSRLYLNFGENWRKDFTVVIARRHLKTFESQGLQPAALAGRWIRVRGWIETRNGPFIEARIAGQIELLADR